MKSISARPDAAGSRNVRRVRKTLQESTDFCKVVPQEVCPLTLSLPPSLSPIDKRPTKTFLFLKEIDAKVQLARRNNGGSAIQYKRRSGIAPRASSSKQSFDTKSDISVASNATQDSITSTKSVPLGSTGFAWAKRQQKQGDVYTRLQQNHPSLRSQKSLDPSPIIHAYTVESDCQDDDSAVLVNGAEASKIPTRAHMLRPGSFDSSEMYNLPDFSEVSQPTPLGLFN